MLCCVLIVNMYVFVCSVFCVWACVCVQHRFQGFVILY